MTNLESIFSMRKYSLKETVDKSREDSVCTG